VTTEEEVDNNEGDGTKVGESSALGKRKKEGGE
jgi:hypothetical protein